MIPIIFALIALLGWGVGDIFTTFGSRKMGSYNSTFYGYLFGGLFSALYIPFALCSWKLFSLLMILSARLLNRLTLNGSIYKGYKNILSFSRIFWHFSRYLY